jgi:hypothetical protein
VGPGRDATPNIELYDRLRHEHDGVVDTSGIEQDIGFVPKKSVVAAAERAAGKL